MKSCSSSFKSFFIKYLLDTQSNKVHSKNFSYNVKNYLYDLLIPIENF